MAASYDPKKVEQLEKERNLAKEHFEYLDFKNRGYDQSDKVKSEIQKLKKTLSIRQSMKTVFDDLPSEFLERDVVDYNNHHMKMKELIHIDSILKCNPYQIGLLEDRIAHLTKILYDLDNFNEATLNQQKKIMNNIQSQITAIYAAQREYEQRTPHIFRGHCGACTFGGTGHVCGANY